MYGNRTYLLYHVILSSFNNIIICCYLLSIAVFEDIANHIVSAKTHLEYIASYISLTDYNDSAMCFTNF